MRKKIVFLLTLLFSLICLHTAVYAMNVTFPGGENAEYVTGLGTEEDPFVFCGAAEEENTFKFDGTAWAGPLSDLDCKTIDNSQSVVKSYSYLGMGSGSQKSYEFSTNIKSAPAEAIYKITATPTSGTKRTCYIKLVLTSVGGVTVVDEVYDGEEKDGYVGTPKLLIPNDTIYDGDGMEHFDVTYQDADGKGLDGKPIKVGKYTVTFTVKDGEEYKPYRGRLVLSFRILEEPQAEYQTKKGGKWIEDSFRKAVLYVYDGGTVRLLQDVPLEFGVLPLNKDMTITSSGKTRMITTETDNHGYLLQIKADVTLEDIIIDGGGKEGLTAKRALIAIGNGSDIDGFLTIGEGAVIRNNNNVAVRGGGGGVALLGGECILDGGEICNNSCAYVGGGIYAKAAKIIIEDGIISRNDAADGGGVYAENCECEINGGEISQNEAVYEEVHGEGFGGGVYIYQGKWVLNDGEINENRADNNGAGLYIVVRNGTGEYTINGGEICDNTAARFGGAIYLNLNITMDINGGKITGNKAENRYAGGIEVAPGCNIKLSGSPVIEQNTSPKETDGGLYYEYYPESGKTIFLLDEMDADASVSWKTSKESNLSSLEDNRLLMAMPTEDRAEITGYDLSKQHYDSEDYDLVLIDGKMYLVERVQAEDITVEPNTLEMEIGEEETLTAILTPEDTTVPITWTSSDEKIATVDNGIVTAKKAGKVTITASTSNGLSDFCEVTVKKEETSSAPVSNKSKKYKITVEDTENGFVQSSHRTAKKGETITLTVQADKEYELRNLKAVDRDGVRIELKDNGDGTYSFAMPRSSVTVTAKFGKTQEFSDPTQANEKDAIILTINDRLAMVFGNPVMNDVAPVIRNERTMLPIRFIVENLGGTVVWNEAEQKAVIVKDKTVIEIFVGRDTAYVNGEGIALDSPAFIENDRTYLPLRFVAENLDATVLWKADTQQVYIVPNEMVK